MARSRTALDAVCIYPESERSEEHTSELQSHSDLVCRLLLEKKNSQNSHWLRITRSFERLAWPRCRYVWRSRRHTSLHGMLSYVLLLLLQGPDSVTRGSCVL